MAKQLSDRYTTAADFADDLRRVLQTVTEAPASRQIPAEAATGEPRAAQSASSRPDGWTPSSSRRRTREAERSSLRSVAIQRAH